MKYKVIVLLRASIGAPMRMSYHDIPDISRLKVEAVGLSLKVTILDGDDNVKEMYCGPDVQVNAYVIN